MIKQFQHFGTDWKVAETGISTGAWFGEGPAPLTTHGVRFTSAWGEFEGSLKGTETETASVPELRSALERALAQRVIRSIEQSQYAWRTAEALSVETGIPVELVRQILETTNIAEVLRAPVPNSQGYLLYSTREHYRRLTPFLQRYAGIVRESS